MSIISINYYKRIKESFNEYLKNKDNNTLVLVANSVNYIKINYGYFGKQLDDILYLRINYCDNEINEKT